MQTSFDESSYTVNDAFGITFYARTGESTIACSISNEALQDINPSTANCGPEAQFLANRTAFQEIASQRISIGEKPPIKITSNDVQAYLAT